MKIGIISDTHDHIDNLAIARKQLDGKIDALIHCGDFCAPFMMEELDLFEVPVHAVFGNIDDRARSPQKANETKFVKLHGDVADIELDNTTILVNHFPEIAMAFAKAGDHDLVCFGHTHIAQEEKINNTLLINPGEIMGRNGKPSYVIFDTETKKAEFFQI